MQRPDGSVWHSPARPKDKGLSSWDILWVDREAAGEFQLRSFLEQVPAPKEILLSGACAALVKGLNAGCALYANEVLDPQRGPHTPCPPRALSLSAIQKALGSQVVAGKFLTTEVPCVTPNHKLESGHGYGAIAVDQDSALLCRPCHERELGHAVLRFVLDPAELDATPGRNDQALLEGARQAEIALFITLAAL